MFSRSKECGSPLFSLIKSATRHGKCLVVYFGLVFQFAVVSLLQSYKKDGPTEPEAQIHKIRITLTSRNVKSLEKGERVCKGECVRNQWTCPAYECLEAWQDTPQPR